MTKEEFKTILNNCKYTIDDCKDGLFELFDKSNCTLDIIFKFRPGEVVTMNVYSSYFVRPNYAIIKEKEGIENE